MTPGRLGVLPEGRRGQALAVGLLLLCLGLAWIVVAAPLLALHAERAEALGTRRALAARMAALAAALPELRAQAATVRAVGPAQAALLDGATDAVAGAALQQLVLELAVRAGATPSSTETLAAEQVGAYRRVGVRIALTAPWPVLVRLLQAADEAATGLLVDDLQIRGSRLLVRPTDVPLDATMTVSAFRAGGSPAGAQQTGAQQTGAQQPGAPAPR